MECPKCSRLMEAKVFKGVEVKRCSGCFGIFCSQQAIEDGKSVWLAEAVLDIGDPATGVKYDKVDDIDCPQCQVKMEKLSDPAQPHIWMEACPQCHQVFLDAGEYTDLKYQTLVDKYRGWRKGKRE
jgi:Zn-finger nucleic acid-binding protein